MREITGFQRKGGGAAGGNEQRANELNQFFNRFNSNSPTPCSTPPYAPLNNNPRSLTQPPTTSCPTPPLSPTPLLPFNTDSFTPPTPRSSSQLIQPHTTPYRTHLSASPLTSPPPNLVMTPTTDPVTPPVTALTPQSSLHITSSQVRRELERLKPRKAAGPDRISPRVLKACSSQLCGVFQHLFNLSLQLQRVPGLSCLVPVPKKVHPVTLEGYRPVALTHHEGYGETGPGTPQTIGVLITRPPSICISAP